MPIRKGIADQVYTVTSSDYMAIYAVNNLFKGILKYSNNGGALLGGVIGNSIKSSLQEDMIKDFILDPDNAIDYSKDDSYSSEIYGNNLLKYLYQMLMAKLN